MKKSLKAVLTVATLSVVIGLVLSLIAFAAVGFDVNRLNGSDIVTESYSFDITNIKSIDVECEVSDVRIVRTDALSDAITVSVRQDKKTPYSVASADGALRITAGERPWYYSVGIFFGEQIIEIGVPANFVFDEISVESDTGDVYIYGVCAGSLNVSMDTGDLTVQASQITGITAELDTGDVELSELSAGWISVESDTGDVDMKNTVATDKITIKSDTGDVELDSCDSYELYVESDTGDVELTLLTPKTFDADSTTGRVSVPSSTTGGACKIRTATGDIEARIK